MKLFQHIIILCLCLCIGAARLNKAEHRKLVEPTEPPNAVQLNQAPQRRIRRVTINLNTFLQCPEELFRVLLAGAPVDLRLDILEQLHYVLRHQYMHISSVKFSPGNDSEGNIGDLSNEEPYDDCPVCMEAVEANATEEGMKPVGIDILPCGHHPHRQCLDRWMREDFDKKCPLCSGPINYRNSPILIEFETATKRLLDLVEQVLEDTRRAIREDFNNQHFIFSQRLLPNGEEWSVFMALRYFISIFVFKWGIETLLRLLFSYLQ